MISLSVSLSTLNFSPAPGRPCPVDEPWSVDAPGAFRAKVGQEREHLQQMLHGHEVPFLTRCTHHRFSFIAPFSVSRTFSHTHAHIHTHAHTNIHTHADILACMHTHSCTHSHTQTFTHTCTLAYTCTHTLARTGTCPPCRSGFVGAELNRRLRSFLSVLSMNHVDLVQGLWPQSAWGSLL